MTDWLKALWKILTVPAGPASVADQLVAQSDGLHMKAGEHVFNKQSSGVRYGKIISDGTTSFTGTKIFTSEGEEIKRVGAAKWETRWCDGDRIPRITVELAFFEIEVEGELIVEHSNGKRIAKIVYMDGTKDVYGEPEGKDG